jgi:hypothetical protein
MIIGEDKMGATEKSGCPLDPLSWFEANGDELQRQYVLQYPVPAHRSGPAYAHWCFKHYERYTELIASFN